MMVYICDRCGKTITRPESTADEPIKRIIDWGFSKYDDPNDGGTLEQMDVCCSCYESFLQWKRMYLMEDN